MSSVQPPNPPSGNNNEKKPGPEASSSTPQPAQDNAMDVTSDQPPEEKWEDIPEDILALPTEDIATRTRLIDNDLKVC
jgi:26S proteasome regulatory subunit T5